MVKFLFCIHEVKWLSPCFAFTKSSGLSYLILVLEFEFGQRRLINSCIFKKLVVLLLLLTIRGLYESPAELQRSCFDSEYLLC